jgi:hypothetical protein
MREDLEGGTSRTKVVSATVLVIEEDLRSTEPRMMTSAPKTLGAWKQLELKVSSPPPNISATICVIGPCGSHSAASNRLNYGVETQT